MRKLVLILISTLFICGCITEKKRAKICQSCPVKIKDSIREVVTVTPFDTALFVSQMGKDIELTLNDNNCCELVDSMAAMMGRANGTITSVNNGVKSSIFKKNKKLVFRCEADSLRAVITLLQKKVESSRTIVKEVPAHCDLAHLTWFNRLTNWWFWITITAILVYIIPRIKRVFF